jgi:multidrug efflux pump subunit AcrA (membrane-fusion protein)
MEVVYVVHDGAARLQLVRTGKHRGDRVELLAGLEPGEMVIADHPERLVDGQPVEVQP